MKRLICSTTFLCLLVAFNASAATLKPYNGGIKKPGLSLVDLAGKPHQLADYRGQVVLVQFWATYCVPCRTEMPSMNRLQQKLKDKPFKILAVDMAEPRAEVAAFVKAVKPEFTILLDEDGQALQDWKVFAAPASFVIDPAGEIKYTLYGGVEWDGQEIVNTLTSLMK